MRICVHEFNFLAFGKGNAHRIISRSIDILRVSPGVSRCTRLNVKCISCASSDRAMIRIRFILGTLVCRIRIVSDFSQIFYRRRHDGWLPRNNGRRSNNTAVKNSLDCQIRVVYADKNRQKRQDTEEKRKKREHRQTTFLALV